MTDFTRTIPGAGSLDLRLTVESGQPRVELVDRVTDVTDLEQHVRYGGAS